MLKLLKGIRPCLKRGYSTTDNLLLCQCIKDRTLIQISGNDANVYLQGLITNDMKHLQDGALSMFAMFLNSKGRLLFDSIIYNSKQENTFFIECDRTINSSLKDHLLRFKVRRKLNIDCLKDEMDIWSVISNKSLENLKDTCDYKKILDIMKKSFPNFTATVDPRLPSLGLRIITPKNFNLTQELAKEINIEVQEKSFYKLLRYKLGVGEGVEELPIEKCIPLEVNGDYLHGISFHKGCYIGQELTARAYHTGVIRKRLMPLIFKEELHINENGIPIFAVLESNKSIGKLHGVEKTNGVGLLRIEDALKAEQLLVYNKKCETHRPFWWPNEAPKERLNIT